MVIKLSAVTVLLDEGDSVSMSPAADPEYATVIVPMEAAAALLTVTIAFALLTAASRICDNFTYSASKGDRYIHCRNSRNIFNITCQSFSNKGFFSCPCPEPAPLAT
jgi:hypothetical protein